MKSKRTQGLTRIERHQAHSRPQNHACTSDWRTDKELHTNEIPFPYLSPHFNVSAFFDAICHHSQVTFSSSRLQDGSSTGLYREKEKDKEAKVGGKR